MKALTLWQPWASLVALGVKTIETRSWSTKYRGPLAIHAARWRPVGSGYGTCERWSKPIGDWRVRRVRIQQGARCVRDDLHLVKLDGFDMRTLSLGAVVATCTLVDVAPMIDLMTGEPDEMHGQSPAMYLEPANRLCISHHFEVPARHIDVSDQRPYGDFSPGRYAWLLADIEPLAEPVSAKGRQGLWEWTPDPAEVSR